MLFRLGTIVAVGILLKFVLYYRTWLDWDTEFVLTVRPGQCHAVKEVGGSEDIVDIGQGHFLMSTGFSFEKTIGEITSLDINGKPSVVAVNLTNVPKNVDGFLASPHGMTTWKDESTGTLYLYVITHPEKEDRIEVFEVQSPYQLRYIKTITDPAFTYMNNLVAVDKDKFYTTRYTPYRDSFSVQLLHYIPMRWGKVMYYDGKRAREVASGYNLPNGISASPDKKMIYIVEWGAQILRGFRRERSNNLVQVWEKHLGSGLDNINVDENGDLWIACHPALWKSFAYKIASKVIRVKIHDDTISDIEEIYADEGHECTGVTGAAYAYGKLIIGTLHDQTILCDVNYLSKH